MAKKTGIDVLVYVDTADVADPVGGAPTWVLLPEQEGAELSIERDETNANTKQNDGWRDAASIGRGWSLSCSGYSDPNDAAFLFLLDTKHLGTLLDVTINVKIENGDGDTLIGKASLGAFKESYDIGGFIPYSAEFSGRGAPTLTRAA